MKIYLSQFRSLSVVLCMLIFLAVSACAQTTLTRRCAGTAPNPGYQKIDLTSTGDINLIPCATKSVLINGSPVNSGGSLFTGTGKTSFLSYFDTENTLTKTAATFDGTQYVFDDTAAGNALFRVRFTPSSATGYFEAGSLSTSIQVNQSTNTVGATAGTFSFGGGGVGGINFTSQNAFNVDATETNFTGGNVSIGTGGLSINGTTATNGNLIVNSDFRVTKAITAPGTTGNIAANVQAGTVNIAAGNNSAVIANNRVATTSIVVATARTNDATCSVKNAVPGAGIITLNLTANCTAETGFAFFVVN